MKRLSIFFAALLMCIAMGGSVMASTYTIEFLTATEDGATEIAATTKASTVVATNSTTYIQAFTTNCSKAFYKGKSGVKIGSKNNAGTLEFTLATSAQNNIKKITIKSAVYGSDTGTLSLAADGTTLIEKITPGKDTTYTYDSKTNVTTITLKTSTKRAYVSSITFETEDEAATGIELNAAELNLEQYKYTTLTATLTPSTATTEVVWSSADETVATVENGKVTAVGIGTTEITATAGNVNAKCTVNVIAATPITVAKAVEIGNALSNNNEIAAGGMYVIHGYVTVSTGTEAADLKKYGNYSVNIDDTKSGKAAFEAYQVVPTDGTSIAEVGDSVEVIGDITRHNTTIETFAKTGTIRILKKATYTVKALSNDADMGNVVGGGTFDRKDSATVRATAFLGFEFVAWVAENKTDTLSKEATYKFEVTQDVKVYAIFKAEEPLTPATWYGQAPLTGTLNGTNPQTKQPINVNYSIVYEITRTALRYLTVKCEINDEAAALTGFKLQCILDGNLFCTLTKDDSGIYSYTTTKKYTDGEIVKIKFYMTYMGGSTYADEISYTVGSSNNKPTAIETVSNNDTKATKRIVNGVLVIEKNGVRYNAQGVVME